MNPSASPGDAPPGYTEHGNTSAATPYGQSTLLHADDETTGQPAKPPDQPPSDDPHPHAGRGDLELYLVARRRGRAKTMDYLL